MSTRLTKREQQVMAAFWDAAQPLSSTGVCEQDPTLNKNTVQAVVKKLMKAGLLEVASIGYSGTVLAHLYRPTLSREQWVAQGLSDAALAGIASQFIAGTESLDTLAQLEALIQSKKAALKDKE